MMSYRDGCRILVGIASSKVAPALDAVRAGKAMIARGMKGPSVEYVQALAGVVANGEYGPKTEEAVKAVQAKYWLQQTGVVNAATLIALDQIAGGTAGVGPSVSTPPEVAPVPTLFQAPSSAPVAASTAMVPVTVATTTPWWQREVPGLARPVWQVAVGSAGLLACATGLYFLARPRRTFAAAGAA